MDGCEDLRRQAYLDAMAALRRRVELLVALPDAQLEGLDAAGTLQQIAATGA